MTPGLHLERKTLKVRRVQNSLHDFGFDQLPQIGELVGTAEAAGKAVRLVDAVVEGCFVPGKGTAGDASSVTDAELSAGIAVASESSLAVPDGGVFKVFPVFGPVPISGIVG